MFWNTHSRTLHDGHVVVTQHLWHNSIPCGCRKERSPMKRSTWVNAQRKLYIYSPKNQNIYCIIPFVISSKPSKMNLWCLKLWFGLYFGGGSWKVLIQGTWVPIRGAGVPIPSSSGYLDVSLYENPPNCICIICVHFYASTWYLNIYKKMKSSLSAVPPICRALKQCQ